ncbi:MAG: methylated-DNA--[protein]-cysteine S-methyltransferase [Gammaproteobacteria bacterium]|nr:methylated-DNA--[protein]-cysteine S-methyltransferase [Gammaproteobacteria bacterium]
MYVIKFPFGKLGYSVENDYLTELQFVAADTELATPTTAISKNIAKQLQQYFADPTFKFDLPLQTTGTEFQQRVWQALREIPVGKTKSYGELAAELKSSARAVGNACRKNPVAIVTPCHRVVAKNSIGGFAGTTEGDLISIKEKLLALEASE